MAKIEIRQYRATDRDRLIDLFRGSVRQVARRDYSPAQIVAWVPDDIDAEGFGRRSADRPTWVAAIDGDLAGFGDLAPDGHIDMLYVHANHQRKGITRSLLDKIESVAPARGSPRICRSEHHRPAGFRDSRISGACRPDRQPSRADLHQLPGGEASWGQHITQARDD